MYRDSFGPSWPGRCLRDNFIGASPRPPEYISMIPAWALFSIDALRSMLPTSCCFHELPCFCLCYIWLSYLTSLLLLGKLQRARDRLYRSQISQPNTRWKPLPTSIWKFRRIYIPFIIAPLRPRKLIKHSSQTITKCWWLNIQNRSRKFLTVIEILAETSPDVGEISWFVQKMLQNIENNRI